MISSPSHIALLVPSVRKAADDLARLGFKIGAEEVFEETREIYIQGDERNPLLLMEPKGPGSYERALKKRGPGFHHFAVDVLNIDAFLSSLSGSGWLLHLNSVKSLKSYQTAYLARPGFPGLIEAQEKKEIMEGPLFVERVALKLDPQHLPLLKAVGLEEIVRPTSGRPSLTIRGQEIDLEKLF